MFSTLDRIKDWTDNIPSQIEEVNDNLILWRFGDNISKDVTFEFHFMQCAQNTEYCTEIHLLIKADESPESNIVERADAILESIRFKINRSWVIEDRDLNSSLLKTR